MHNWREGVGKNSKITLEVTTVDIVFALKIAVRLRF